MGELRDVFNCHCDPCRRFTGHFMAATATEAKNLVIESEKTLTWWQRTPTVSYGFCSKCGSSLFWKASDKSKMISILAGSLKVPTGLVTTLAIYSDDASDYHQLDLSIRTTHQNAPELA